MCIHLSHFFSDINFINLFLYLLIALEIGSSAFLKLVIFSLLVSHSLLVIMSYLLYMYTDYTSSYHTCCVGFSAILFALKYVWNKKANSNTNIIGISVPSKYAAWVELVVISFISPNSSFLGHLSGILAGILYIDGSSFIQRIISQFSSPDGNGHRNEYDSANNRYTYAAGTASSPSSSSSSSSSSFSQSNSRPQRSLEVQFPRQSVFSSQNQNDPIHHEHDAETIRRQRLNRFAR